MQRYNFFLTLANLFSHLRHNHLCTAEELQERLLQSFTTVHSAQLWAQWKITGAMIILLPNRECNQKQKHKKQPWGKVECFAFGSATVRFASLETSFHAANHTPSLPPSYEGLPLCPKDKNRSPFHGEKPLIQIILW